MRRLQPYRAVTAGLIGLAVFAGRDASAQVFGRPVTALNSNAATDTGGDFRPQIASDGTGTWVVVWDSDDSLGGTIGTDSDILFVRSTDGGVTWTAPAALNSNAAGDSGTDVRPQLATDRAGTWVAVWDSTDSLGGTIGTDGDILVARSTDGGATWSAPSALNTNAATDSGADAAPQIVTDRAGTWLAVWASSDSLGGTIGIDFDILVARSTDGGVTWSAPAALNTDATIDSADDEFPRLATDGGSWVAVWHTHGGPFGLDFDVVVAHSTDGGATWSAPAVLNPVADGASDTFPAIATDRAGAWVAAWSSSNSLGGTIGTEGDLLMARSTDGGATWSAAAALNTDAATDAGSDAFVALATDGTGTWLAVWQSVNALGGALGGDQDILFSSSTDGGATWRAPGPLDAGSPADTGSDFVAQVAGDDLGRWIGVWSAVNAFTGIFGVDVDILTARSVLCPNVPENGCLALSASGKAKLRVVHASDDRLAWSWSTHDPAPGFGNPLASDGYTLCLYDESGTSPALLIGAEAPGGGTCAGEPCWSPIGTGGFAYRDKDRTPNGIKDVRLRGGPGSTRLALHGKGRSLPFPFGPLLPLALPVRVQLSSTTGTCWDASFLPAGIKRSNALEFRGIAVP